MNSTNVPIAQLFTARFAPLGRIYDTQVPLRSVVVVDLWSNSLSILATIEKLFNRNPHCCLRGDRTVLSKECRAGWANPLPFTKESTWKVLGKYSNGDTTPRGEMLCFHAKEATPFGVRCFVFLCFHFVLVIHVSRQESERSERKRTQRRRRKRTQRTVKREKRPRQNRTSNLLDSKRVSYPQGYAGCRQRSMIHLG